MSLARVACIIPARDAADRIQATVTAARSLPGVDIVIVNDDASSDETASYAAASGAIIATHERARGRAAAIESAVNALGVLEQRDRRPECGTILLLDADLGASASHAQHLIGPVVTERRRPRDRHPASTDRSRAPTTIWSRPPPPAASPSWPAGPRAARWPPTAA